MELASVFLCERMDGLEKALWMGFSGILSELCSLPFS
jgi:hypothetical protein